MISLKERKKISKYFFQPVLFCLFAPPTPQPPHILS